MDHGIGPDAPGPAGAHPPAASGRPLASYADAPLGELLVAMGSGSVEAREAAWAACYERYRDVVWTRVFYVVRSIGWLAEPREVAADVTSDVFVGLADAARRYREEGRAEYWLKQVAVRTALRAKERLTGQWKDARAATRGPAAARTQVSFDDQAEHIVALLDEVERDELMELERRVAALRASTDARQRRWADFIDLYRQGYGFAEIGERLAITEGTARNWLVAIRRHLAEPLRAEAADD